MPVPLKLALPGWCAIPAAWLLPVAVMVDGWWVLELELELVSLALMLVLLMLALVLVLVLRALLLAWCFRWQSLRWQLLAPFLRQLVLWLAKAPGLLRSRFPWRC